MQFINTFREGISISDIYLVRNLQNATTKNGKPYQTITLQDKTGTIDGKIWDLKSPGIEEFEVLDYVMVNAEIIRYMNNLQANVKRVRRAQEGDYNPADYLPVSAKDPSEMYRQILSLIESIKEPHMKALLKGLFVEDEAFVKRFRLHSAAKSVHHNFVGGLLEHTLSVAQLCDFYASHYTFLDRDLLLTAALCHDIGKVYEISPFPQNDYTDAGQLLGHIVISASMVRDRASKIKGFPKVKERELLHCILAHHGALEFGSPKKPALIEALALAFADNTDAKIETFRGSLQNVPENDVTWKGFNRFLDTNVRRTSRE